MTKRVNHQGGWVTSFIVVGVLLLLALLGSIYFLKHRPFSNDQIAKNDSSKTTSQPAAKKSETKSGSKSTSSSEKSHTNQPSTSHSSSSSSNQHAARSSSEGKASTSTPTLPATGPADALANAAILSLLGFAVVSYARSRKLSLVTRV